MSSLPTYNAEPGTTVDAASVNNLFTGVGTATSSLDASNVRAQGVDVGQVDVVSANNDGIVTRYASQDDNTTSNTYASTADRVVATFTLGTAMDIRPGDVWRCYYSVRITDQNSSVTNEANLETMTKRVGAGWIFWLEWDIGSGYESIPGQEGFSTSHYSGVNDDAGNPVPHMPTNETLTSMVFPHVSVAESVPAGVYQTHQYVGTTGLGSAFNRSMRRSRAFHYRRPVPSTTVSVAGIRIMVRGVVSLGRDPGGSGDGLLFVRDTAMYGTDPTFGGASDTITVDNKRLINIVQAEQ